jgi:hypothetical protein
MIVTIAWKIKGRHRRPGASFVVSGHCGESALHEMSM